MDKITMLLALLTACASVISWFLIDTLQGLRKAIETLNASLISANNRLGDHETRISVLESTD